MKICQILLLFSILISQSVYLFAAEDVSLGQWSGANGLSVAVEGDGGTCPPTSHGHGVETPCSELSITGTTTPVVGNQYSVEGGKLPYVWSISAGSINIDTGIITSLSGTCGTGLVSVADSCGNRTEKEVRFSAGQWVLESEEGFFPGSAPCRGERICKSYSGGTRTDSYYYNLPTDCANWYGDGCNVAEDGSYDGVYPIYVCCRGWGECNLNMIPCISFDSLTAKIYLAGKRNYRWVCQ